MVFAVYSCVGEFHLSAGTLKLVVGHTGHTGVKITGSLYAVPILCCLECEGEIGWRPKSCTLSQV